MKILKTLNPKQVTEDELAGWQRREAARAVVFDEDHKVGLLHASNHDYYKLPGGGIEAGEDIKTALDRECEEELGVKVEVLEEIGQIIEYRNQIKLHQISYCFLARASSGKQTPNFTDDEKASGFEVVWVSPEEALRLLAPKHTTDYEGKFIEERDFCFLNEGIRLAKFK